MSTLNMALLSQNSTAGCLRTLHGSKCPDNEDFEFLHNSGCGYILLIWLGPFGLSRADFTSLPMSLRVP